MKLLTMICIPALLLITGCEKDNYQLTKSDDGTLYKLNKKTGEMLLVKGDVVTAVQSETDKKNAEEQLAQKRDWDPEEIPNWNIRVGLTTSWRSGTIYYKCIVAPYSAIRKIHEKIKTDVLYNANNPNAGFVLNLKDSNGFLLKSIPIRLNQMSETVDDSGKTIFLTANSEDKISESAYHAISSWGLSWKLDEKLREPTEAEVNKALANARAEGDKKFEGEILQYAKENGITLE